MQNVRPLKLVRRIFFALSQICLVQEFNKNWHLKNRVKFNCPNVTTKMYYTGKEICTLGRILGKDEPTDRNY